MQLISKRGCAVTLQRAAWRSSASQGHWKRACGGVAGEHKDELEGRGLPNGSPSALIICVAAMGCLSMIKKMPELNKVKSDIGLASVSASHTMRIAPLCAPV